MRSWQRWGVPLAALATSMTWAAAPGLGTTAVASPRPAVAGPPGCYGGDLFDFNDDGHTDVAVGQPGAMVGHSRGAGAVEVRFGCDALPPQRLRLPHPHKGDRFGAALAQGYYSDGGVAEHKVLFVGVPYLDVDGHKNAGGVAEFRAGEHGLTFAKLWTQASKGVPGTVQGGAHFGAALSLSDEDEERFFLRIGAPGLNVGNAKDTGAVITLSWAEDPDEAEGNGETTVADYGVKAQDGDLFGSSFSDTADTHRVGAPGRRVDGHRGAGAVFEDSEPRMVSQATPGVPGSPETNDHFGATLSHDWIGVPGEAIGDVAGAGRIEYWNSSEPAEAQEVDQDTAGVPGAVGADHHFGAALAYNDIARYSGYPDQDDLVVGAPGDRSGVGSVTVLRIPDADGPFAGSGVALPGADEAGGHVGTAVATSGDDRILAGAPDAGAGRVYAYRLSTDAPGTPVLETSWTPAGASPPAGTGFGSVLPTSFGEE